MDISTTINKYNILFIDYCKQNKTRDEEYYKNMRDLCITLLLDDGVSIEKKEELLAKLIFANPDDTQLYYFMGYLLRDACYAKSLMWFRLCIKESKVPNVENFLDLMQCLYVNEIYSFMDYLLELYPDYLNPSKVNDVRVINMLLCKSVKTRQAEESDCLLEKYGITRFLQQIPKVSNNVFSSVHQPISNKITQSVLMNSIITYFCRVGNVKKAIQYVNPYIIQYADIDTTKRLFGRFLLMWSYISSTKCVYIDQYLPTEEDYIKHNYEYRDHCIKHNSIYEITHNYSFSHNPANKITPMNNIQTDSTTSPSIDEGISSHKYKIGYISNNFSSTSVIANFITPILNNHNGDLFEIHLFVFNKIDNPFIYQRYLHIHQLDINNISNYNSDIIYKTNIDILIDLDTCSDQYTLDILSKNPAPIQIGYIGYPNSIGLDFIHYRITDNIADNPSSSQVNKETLIKLPGCFLLYQNILQTFFSDMYDYNKHSVTFGLINDEIKNSDVFLYAVGKILQRNLEAKILIKINFKDNADTQSNYYSEKLKVDKSRIIIKPYSGNDEYIKTFAEIDILLDSFPYCGTTTTCNALYNSVPVITLYNKHFHCSNVTTSILFNCGLPELVAYSIDEYISKAYHLSNNMEMIREYRRWIRSKFMASMEPIKFMLKYEKALIDIYQQNH